MSTPATDMTEPPGEDTKDNVSYERLCSFRLWNRCMNKVNDKTAIVYLQDAIGGSLGGIGAVAVISSSISVAYMHWKKKFKREDIPRTVREALPLVHGVLHPNPTYVKRDASCQTGDLVHKNFHIFKHFFAR